MFRVGAVDYSDGSWTSFFEKDLQKSYFNYTLGACLDSQRPTFMIMGYFQ